MRRESNAGCARAKLSIVEREIVLFELGAALFGKYAALRFDVDHETPDLLGVCLEPPAFRQEQR